MNENRFEEMILSTLNELRQDFKSGSFGSQNRRGLDKRQT